MKKVLILPSWYPTPEKKVGFFFQEQASIMQGLYDLRVLFFQEKDLSRKKHLLKYLLQKFFGKYDYQKVQLNADPVYLNPPLHYYHYKKLTKNTSVETLIKLYTVALKELIAEGWTPDLIHAHTVKNAGIIAHALNREFGIPYLITEHNFFALPAFEAPVRPLVKSALEKANEVLTVSHDKSRQILSYGVDVEPTVVWNLVQEERFPVQLPYQSPGKLNIISITAASFIKDNLTLLRMLKEIRDRNIDFHATIIGIEAWGKERERQEIRNFIANEKLEAQVEIIGWVEREALSRYFSGKHVFILTSIAEGLPVSVLEAMASGLYVIATRHGGSEDIIQSPAHGSIIPLKDYRAGAAILEQLAKGERTYDPERIRNHIVSLCGHQAFRNRIAEIYDHTMNKAVL